MKKIGVIQFILLSIVTIWSCRPPEEEKIVKLKQPVRLTPVRQEELSKPVRISGRIASKQELKLSFKIGGIIDRMYVDEGQKVAPGRILAKLDLSEIESQVEQARSGYMKSERDWQRAKNLYSEKAATLEQLQNAETAFSVARSRLNAAEFNLRFAKIEAPSHGRIIKRLAEEHELVGAGTPVYIFASSAGDWIIRAGVSEVDIIRLRLEDPATVSFDAYPGETFEAAVSEIVEAPDPYTGTYEVELRILEPDKPMISGFVAKVDILPRQKTLRSVIPVDALVQADGIQGFTFTIDENSRARRIPILIDFITGDSIAVAKGLEQISHVVTEGGAYLRDGDEVEILNDRR